MFRDYITLLLANMTAGLVVLAFYFITGAGKQHRRHWAPAFAAPGLVALVAGLHMTLTWPIPTLAKANLAWANVAYGEMSVLFGVLFLAAALSLAMEWNLTPVGVYALVASLAAGLIGVRILDLHLSASPTLTGAGYLLTAAGGIASSFALCRRGRLPRALAALLLLAAAGIWAFTAAGAYWAHLKAFSKV